MSEVPHKGNEKDIVPKTPRRRRGARFAIITIEILAGILVLTSVVLGIAVWRLSSEPVQLNFLTPYLNETFNESLDGREVQVGETLLIWDETDKEVELRARSTVLRGREGGVAAIIPEISLKLSFRALLQGRVAPTQIEILGAHIELVRTPDGDIKFGGVAEERPSVAADEEADVDVGPDQDEQPSEGQLTEIAPEILEELLTPERPDRQLSFLREVRVVGGTVTLHDQRINFAWLAPNADLSLRRDDVGLSGEIDLDLGPSGWLARLTAAFTYDRELDEIDTAARLSSVRLPALSSLFPPLAALSGVTTPLESQVSATFTPTGKLISGNFLVRGEEGSISFPELNGNVLPVRSLEVEAALDGPQGPLRVTRGEILFGSQTAPGPEVRVQGSMTAAGELLSSDLAVSLTAEALNVPMGELAAYWPETLADNAREWVTENIPDGTAKRATLEAALAIPGADPDALELLSLNGTLGYEDLEVHYLRPLPPITGIAGQGTFDVDNFDLKADKGQLGDIDVSGGTVVISGLDQRGLPPDSSTEAMSIDVMADGPLRSVLEILDHERLDLISGMGLAPADSSGNQSAQLSFRFPLINDLSFDDIELEVLAHLEDGGLKQFALQRDVTEAALSLEITKDGMRAKGPAKLGGVPLTIDWAEDFSGTQTYRTDLTASVPDLDHLDMRRLGLDPGDFYEGSASAEISVVFDRDKRGTVKGIADMERGRFAIPSLNWDKPVGLPGEARFTLSLVGEEVVSYPSIDLSGEGFRFLGRGRPGDDGTTFGYLEMDEFTIDKSAVKGATLVSQGDDLKITVSSGVFDIEPILEELDSSPGGTATTNDGAPPSAVPARTEYDGTLVVEAPSLERMILSDGRELKNVSVYLERRSDGWHTIRFNGSIPEVLWHPDGFKPGPENVMEEERTLVVTYHPDETGGRELVIKSNDFGAALRALNINDNVQGGTFRISGARDGPSPQLPLKATIKAKDFALYNAPTTAKILTLASLTDFATLLGGSGLPFKRLEGEFIEDKGVIKSELIRAFGNAVGLTARGTIDTDDDQVMIEGTIVPAYTFNRIIGSIPLLGTILTGGEGEGIFAATYRVQGAVEAPDVSVNPLSFLAPGFLRNVFSGSGEETDSDIGNLNALPEDRGPAQ